MPFYDVIQKAIYEIFWDKDHLSLNDIAGLAYCFKKLNFKDQIYIDLTK